MPKSIQSRVAWQVSGLIALAMILITVLVALIAYGQMHNQVVRLLEDKTQALGLRLEQRLDYLIESSSLLAKNDFVIRAFIDGNTAPLPVIVKNYVEGKDILALSIVDFDGTPLYQMTPKLPSFRESTQLRAALAMGKTTASLDADNNIMLIAPVEYYGTVQGAVIGTFDLKAMTTSVLRGESKVRLELLTRSQSVFVHNPFENLPLVTSTLASDAAVPHLNQLGFQLAVGLPESEFMNPVYSILWRLFGVGMLFVVAGVGVSILLGRSITQPILTLVDRVSRWDLTQNIVCSPTGTEDELETLATTFDKQSIALTYQAEHDMLTGLPNRFLFDVFIEQAITDASQHNATFALLFLDLDNFKEINDSFGHLAGDALLRIIAKKLAASIGPNDKIARMGGDEFAIVMQGPHLAQETVEQRIKVIMEHFSETQEIENYKFFITCSIGVAIFPRNGQDPQTLLKNADAAMYKSKEEGKNGYHFYTQDMTQKAYERVILEAKMHDAIKNGELVVFYQPQVDIATSEIIGIEALVRWSMPNGQMISPATFVPLAEKSGMIVAIDDFVMQTAMNDYAVLRARGFTGTLALNLSMIQLNQSDFIHKLDGFIKTTQMSIDKLKLEVTETQVMKNPENAILMLRKLRDKGIGLAVDDFGTGHSSLSYLKQLPIEKIKIDQSFVRDLPLDNDDMQLVTAIISLARNLHLSLIAEGVETEEQAQFLLKNGCPQAQGYLYYKPMPLDQLLGHI